MQNEQKTMNDYLEMDGHLAFNIAIFNRFSSIAALQYSEICGGFNDGVYQWARHNIADIAECENAKYMGWTIMIDGNYCAIARRVFIEKWVMKITPKDWKHAKSLFNKYLREDVKFNNEQFVNEMSMGV